MGHHSAGRTGVGQRPAGLEPASLSGPDATLGPHLKFMIRYNDVDLDNYQPLMTLQPAMSKEVTVEDAKKFAQRCKALEAQLRQTITKKEHHEIVLEFEDKMTDMEKTIAGQEKKIGDQEKELERTKTELQRSIALNKQIADVSGRVASLADSNSSQAKALDSLVVKVTQGAVPLAVHQQSLSKINDLEERIGGMVSRSDYAALRLRYDEAERRISSMIPAPEHEALKERVFELENTISTMVPKEEFESSEATAKELRATLAEHVPQSVYDDLVSKVVQLAEEVTGGQAFVEEEPIPQESEPAEPEQPSPEVGPSEEPSIPSSPAPIPSVEAPPVEAATGEVEAHEEATPEITEVGSKLAELKTEVIVEKPAEALPAGQGPAQAPPVEEVDGEKLVVLTSVAESESKEESDQSVQAG